MPDQLQASVMSGGAADVAPRARAATLADRVGMNNRRLATQLSRLEDFVARALSEPTSASAGAAANGEQVHSLAPEVERSEVLVERLTNMLERVETIN